MRRGRWGSGFGWQSGYGAFSVGHSNVESVIRYIANQEEHHRKVTFQEEYLAFLKKHEIEFDERYIWDSIALTPLRGFHFNCTSVPMTYVMG